MYAICMYNSMYVKCFCLFFTIYTYAIFDIYYL